MSELMRLTYSYDGDTIGAWRMVNGKQEQTRIRLAYLDAPELAQGLWGLRARTYLRTLLYINEPIIVDIKGTDPYGRLIAEVLRQRDYGNLGLRLVLGGYAALWMCPSDQPAFQAAEAIAKAKRTGIWAVPGLHQTPWLFR